jgi:hypothetical protein
LPGQHRRAPLRLGGAFCHHRGRGRLSVPGGTSASWIYLRRCLIFSLPLAIGFAAFYLGFYRDPLWPNQDMTEAQSIDYQADYAQAQHTYATSAALTSVALLWLIYKAATTFRQMRRLSPTTTSGAAVRPQ